MEAREGKECPEGPPEGGGEPTRELTAAGGQFLLRADVVEFRRGDLLGGRYQIEKAIGRGATGSVLQAFDRVVRSVVAVKILRPDLATDERWIERLGGELRYARKLQHPNVCRVFDLGEADGHHFLTMEFASAGSLRQRLADVPDRTWDERIADARAVIEGLVAIHAANIVHRDVKPENVLVMEDGRLVVSDFGVAVSAGHTTYFSSKVAGTPSYMAPEVIMGDKATSRADVFSLGIVLHEILFGRRPDWQMTKQGRVLKAPAGRKATKREQAFARLISECLLEYAPDRLVDAAEVKRRFEQAVSGRMKPIRGRLREKWPVLVGALAVAASVTVLWVTRERQAQPTADAGQHRIARLMGTPVDLGTSSRLVLAGDKPLWCFDILPGKKSARIVWGEPREALDVDLATGGRGPAKIISESFQADCPRLSPDGRRLLFVRDDAKRAQIMLSNHPDGRDALPVTEGTAPSWLPSGEEFVYSFDSRRGAVFVLPKTRLLLPDSPPFEKELQAIAVSAQGDKVALLFLNSGDKVSVNVYGYPSMGMLQSVYLPQWAGGMQFDDRRETLQLSVPDPKSMSLSEVTASGDLNRLAVLPGGNIRSSGRTEFGLALAITKFSRSLVVTAPSGEQQTFGPTATKSADLTDSGDAIFDALLPDGRVVIAYRQWGNRAPRHITSGPLDLFPSLGPDGTFVFVRSGDNTIVLCGLGEGGAERCRTIFTDALGPKLPSVSPDGTFVAYQTTHGSASRLRVVRRDSGEMRDFGIYRSTCSPVWSPPASLWIPETDSRTWIEYEAVRGKPTGRREWLSRTSEGSNCGLPPSAGTRKFRAQHLDTRSSEVRLAPAL